MAGRWMGLRPTYPQNKKKRKKNKTKTHVYIWQGDGWVSGLQAHLPLMDEVIDHADKEGAYTFSKVLSIVTWYSKCTRALTFENFYLNPRLA